MAAGRLKSAIAAQQRTDTGLVAPHQKNREAFTQFKISLSPELCLTAELARLAARWADLISERRTDSQLPTAPRLGRTMMSNPVGNSFWCKRKDSRSQRFAIANDGIAGFLGDRDPDSRSRQR